MPPDVSVSYTAHTIAIRGTVTEEMVAAFKCHYCYLNFLRVNDDLSYVDMLDTERGVESLVDFITRTITERSEEMEMIE